MLDKIIIYFFLGMSLLSSCKKDNNTNSGNAVQGTINLEVHAKHHSWDVAGIMIYLKKNTTEFPGKDSSVYNYSGKTDGYGKFNFEHLYPGNYYIYASGYDNVWGANVIGYIPAVLDKNNVIDNYLGITIYVSE